jgi:hypothetical protein
MEVSMPKRIADFIDPSQVDKDVFLSLLEKKLSAELRTWLSGLIAVNPLPEKDGEQIKELIARVVSSNSSAKNWSAVFKPLFLFDELLFSKPDLSRLFDTALLDEERVTFISSQGTLTYMAHILPQIKQCAEQNERFAGAYQARLKSIREKPIHERVEGYFRAGTPLALVAEWEDIPEALLADGLLIFLVYGKEVYISIAKLFNGITDTKVLEKIPKWDKKGSLGKIFLEFAILTENFSVLEHLFAGMGPVQKINTLYSYIKDKHRYNNQLFWLLYMEEYPDVYSHIDSKYVIEPATREMESRVILAYLKRICETAPIQDRLTLFQALFPMLHAPQNGVDLLERYIANEFPDLYGEFTGFIAQCAVSFPVKTFMPLELFQQYDEGISSFEVDIFCEYCDAVTAEKMEECFLLGKFWYRLAVNCDFRNSSLIYESPALDNLIRPFIKDADFLYQFLSIPMEIYIDTYFQYQWVAAFLSLYFMEQLDAWDDDDELDTVECITQLLLDGRKLFIPDAVLEIVRSLVMPEIDEKSDPINFLRKLFVALNPDDTENRALCEKLGQDSLTSLAETRYQMWFIMYWKQHETFDPADFIANWLQVDLHKIAADEFGELAVLEQLPVIIEKQLYASSGFENRHKLLQQLKKQRYDSQRSFIAGLLLCEEEAYIEKQIAFFDMLYRRVEGEREGEYLELYTFLELLFEFVNAVDAMFDQYPERKKAIGARCLKTLEAMEVLKIEPELPEPQWILYRCAIDAAWFRAKIQSLWQGIKHLIPAFIKSEGVVSERLVGDISPFFDVPEDQQKKLRQDMAEGLAELLKPTKKRPLAPETESTPQGFDLTRNEPDPILRCAYVHVIAELGVNKRAKGHFIHTILEQVAENDPSDEVRTAARKTAESLSGLRDGWADGPHKARLLRAFWWIKQARLRIAGEPIDEALAKLEYQHCDD